MERGGLAFSWDSKTFAQAHPDYNPNGDKEVTVYKFDNKTGVISDPHHISDPGTVDNPYDVTFSPDNSKLYFSTGFGTLGVYDISSWNTATMATSLKFIKGVNTGSHSAIEIGGDGNLYMATPYGAMGKVSGNLNTGALTFTNIPGATTNRGLPTMYLPPFEEPDIEEVGPFCTNDPPVDLNTKWICKGIDAEDPVNNPDAYSGNGITDKGKGIFSPAIAKEGTHMIIFKRCSVDDTIYITVKPCGCPDTTLKPMPPICADGSLDLDPYKVTVESGSWSIVATPPASTATLTGTVFNANHTVAGNYTVRYTLDKKVKGCADSAERVIIVNPLPVVTATSGTINCYGQSTTCTASGAITYTWSNGDLGQSITVTPLAATSYTVTGVDANGCKDTGIVHITVPDKLELSTSFTNVNCLGKDNGTATVSATGGTPAYAYLWSNGQNTAAITGLPMGTYTVIVTDSKSCMATIGVTIGAPVLPTADFNFSTACFGTAVTFNDHSNPGTGNTITSYKWDFGDPTSTNNIDDSNSPQPHIYNNITTYTVKLLIITNNGCKDSITKKVDVWPVPKADFGAPISGCKPVCANFKDLSTITGGVISKWTWTFGDPGSGAANTSTTQSPETHCYLNPGFYHVTLTVESDKGCKNTITKKDMVNVLSSPKAAFTSNIQEAEIFHPNFEFYDRSTGSPTSWHWDFGVTNIASLTATIDGSITLPTNVNSVVQQLNWIPPTSFGAHTLKVSATDNNGLNNTQTITFTLVKSDPVTCGYPEWDVNTTYATINTLVIHNGLIFKNKYWTKGDMPYMGGSSTPWILEGVCPGNDINTIISKQASEEPFFIYPNPTNGMVYFNARAGNSGELSILDVKGAVLYKGKISAGGNEIDLHQFSQGIYFMQIQLNGTIYYQKLIRQ